MLDRSSKYSTITFQTEALGDCLQDAKALFPGHWDEIASHKEFRRFNPDFNLRFIAEKHGKLLIATARDAGRLIGYIDWLIYGDMNAKDNLIAETDIYYVEERPNRALILRSVIKCSLRALEDRGVTIIRPRTKAKTEGLGRGAGLIWESLGFKLLEFIYSKEVGRATE